jgi:hypothetical protein
MLMKEIITEHINEIRAILWDIDELTFFIIVIIMCYGVMTSLYLKKQTSDKYL